MLPSFSFLLRHTPKFHLFVRPFPGVKRVQRVRPDLPYLVVVKKSSVVAHGGSTSTPVWVRLLGEVPSLIGSHRTGPSQTPVHVSSPVTRTRSRSTPDSVSSWNFGLQIPVHHGCQHSVTVHHQRRGGRGQGSRPGFRHPRLQSRNTYGPPRVPTRPASPETSTLVFDEASKDILGCSHRSRTRSTTPSDFRSRQVRSRKVIQGGSRHPGRSPSWKDSGTPQSLRRSPRGVR